MRYDYDADVYFDDDDEDDEEEEGGEGIAGKLRAFIAQRGSHSVFSVHIPSAADGDTGYAVRLRDTFIEMFEYKGPDSEKITVLGTAAPGCDPLQTALDAAPELLTFPPTAVVNIETDAPDQVADAIRFTSSPGSNRVRDLFGDDSGAVRFDELAPLCVRINRRLHFAAEIGDQWPLIPMTVDGVCRVPLLTREFITTTYDFDSGGMIGSGFGKEVIGEIRPGLNAYWDKFDGETYNFSVSRSDLVEFAAGHACYSKFEAAIIRHLIDGSGGSTDADLDGYSDVSPSCEFEPGSEEGVRFLRALRACYSDGSDVGTCIEAFLGSAENA